MIIVPHVATNLAIILSPNMLNGNIQGKCEKTNENN
jgi:hypothetical protein